MKQMIRGWFHGILNAHIRRRTAERLVKDINLEKLAGFDADVARAIDADSVSEQQGAYDQGRETGYKLGRVEAMAESTEVIAQLHAEIDALRAEQARSARRAGILSGATAGVIARAIDCIDRGQIAEAKRLLETVPTPGPAIVKRMGTAELAELIRDGKLNPGPIQLKPTFLGVDLADGPDQCVMFERTDANGGRHLYERPGDMAFEALKGMTPEQRIDTLREAGVPMAPKESAVPLGMIGVTLRDGTTSVYKNPGDAANAIYLSMTRAELAAALRTRIHDSGMPGMGPSLTEFFAKSGIDIADIVEHPDRHDPFQDFSNDEMAELAQAIAEKPGMLDRVMGIVAKLKPKKRPHLVAVDRVELRDHDGNVLASSDSNVLQLYAGQGNPVELRNVASGDCADAVDGPLVCDPTKLRADCPLCNSFGEQPGILATEREIDHGLTDEQLADLGEGPLAVKREKSGDELHGDDKQAMKREAAIAQLNGVLASEREAAQRRIVCESKEDIAARLRVGQFKAVTKYTPFSAPPADVPIIPASDVTSCDSLPSDAGACGGGE